MDFFLKNEYNGIENSMININTASSDTIVPYNQKSQTISMTSFKSQRTTENFIE